MAMCHHSEPNSRSTPRPIETTLLFIEQRFTIHYSVHQTGRYLKKWGFTVHKPGREAFEQCPEEVQNRLEGEYPIIKKQAKAENAEKFSGVMKWGCDLMQPALAVSHSKGKRRLC